MSEKVDEIAVSAQLNKRLKKILDVRLESDKVKNTTYLHYTYYIRIKIDSITLQHNNLNL